MREIRSSLFLCLALLAGGCPGPTTQGGDLAGSSEDQAAAADLRSEVDGSTGDLLKPGDMAAAGDITATANGTARSFLTQTARYTGSTTGIVGANVTFQGVALQFPGKTTGTFTCGTSGVFVNYSDGTARWTTINQAGASCTITVTAFGEVGGRITGTFSATTKPLLNATGNVELTSGTFNVLRQADQ